MSLRVTDGAASYGSLAGLQAAASRLATLQAKLSSGKQITRPSDDPSGTVRALQLRGDLKRNTQYAANASDAIAWMSTADTSYAQLVKLTQNARTLVVQGLNTGASTGQSASAIADQVDAIRRSMINIANTTYNGRPVFGGTTAGATAYDASGNYVGDNGSVARQVGSQTTVQISQNGPQIFGAAGSDLFTLLGNVSTALRANPSTLSGGALAALDQAISNISAAQAAEGAAYQRVQVAQSAQTNTNLTITSQLSEIQDIDLPSMTIQVSTANINYQAALQTTASVRQVSLLNFLN
jgi:flagellar hook-associated protein 3 FlgL